MTNLYEMLTYQLSFLISSLFYFFPFSRSGSQSSFSSLSADFEQKLAFQGLLLSLATLQHLTCGWQSQWISSLVNLWDLFSFEKGYGREK